MKKLISTWWSAKSEQEKADLQSVGVISLNSLYILPAFIIVML